MMTMSVLAQEIAVDGRPAAQVGQKRLKWIEHVRRSISTIKPGRKRQELAPVSSEEGGLQLRGQGRYVHVRCPYIKYQS